MSEKKQISKSRVKITISVDGKKMEDYFEAEYQKMAPSVTLPGFRAGKAPRLMVIEAIGHGKLAQNAVEVALNNSYRESLIEHKLYPVTQPAISIVTHPSFAEGADNNELKFDVEFDILPEAKIGDYKKFKVKKSDEKELEVKEEEIDKVIEYLSRQAANLEDTDKSLEKGLWAVISFSGSIKGVIKEKLTSNSMPLVIGETAFIPGFEEKIIGMKKGESKTFEITFPKDFQDKEFAGEKVEFTVKLEDIKTIKMPKVDNEFAKKFGRDNVKDMRKAIAESLKQEKKDRQRQELVSQINEQIVKSTKVEIPDSLVDQEKNRMKNALVQDLSQKGITLDKYLENLKLTEEKIDNDLVEQAKKNILLGVGLGEIAKAESIQLATDKDTAIIYDKILEAIKVS